MARDYDKIYIKILNEGFFSEYLPPCFSLNEEIFSKIPSQNCDLIKPYSFSMSRFNANNLEMDTIELIKKVSKLREEFERENGKIKKISGDVNPADLGFHR